MRSKEVLSIVATWLDKLKLANPAVFVAVILACYGIVFLINRPDVLSELTGISVTPAMTYVRDALTAYMGLASGSTFNYLAADNPKKVAALGTTDGNQEKI